MPLSLDIWHTYSINMKTFEIIFDASEIDSKLYPECTMFGKNSIVVDSDRRYVIPSGDGKVKLSINGEFKVYTNVFAVAPYVYNEG